MIFINCPVSGGREIKFKKFEIAIRYNENYNGDAVCDLLSLLRCSGVWALALMYKEINTPM